MQLVSETRPQVRRDRLLRLNEVETVTGLKKSTLYALMRSGKFVRSIQITPKCVAWPESHVLQWVQDKITEACPPESGETSAARGIRDGANQ